MTNADLTHIVAVLDRSGSMQTIRQATEDGFQEFIAEQAKVPGTVKVTLVQFDTEVETVYRNKPLESVPRLNLVPRGMTALYDAVGRAIDEKGAELAALPENERPGVVLFLILTDGYENASQDVTASSLKKRIKTQTDTYSWQFIFLGSNQDAVLTAGSIGIAQGSALTYTGQNTSTAFSKAANYSTVFRGAMSSGLGYNVAVASAAFDADDREEAVAEPSAKPKKRQPLP